MEAYHHAFCYMAALDSMAGVLKARCGRNETPSSLLDSVGQGKGPKLARLPCL